MDKYIVNEDGKIFYKVIGEGKPILFIHGGPGLTHNYFLPHFLELAKLNYKLIFFDQRAMESLPI
ncbi:alpha/beta hydrolase fold domain protein [[Clostridium] sordellii ATCC 9714]|nr:alpha/beta hydrolase fold domain protein [[Clostridium] sordellii ATCC 9714] [Paeniclostridium sordellii ATCC 9714]